MKKIFQVLGIVTLQLVGLYYIEECSGTKDQSEAVEDVQDDLEMEKSVHLKFKGVPIDGTLKEFISRMERKGFEHRSSYDSKERLVGDFAGIKQCMVYVEIEIWYLALLSGFPNRHDGRNCLAIIKT